MRSTLLNTDTEDLKELLSNGKTYSVPPYQRDYSWKQEQWEDLWEDLAQLRVGSEDHYMGAIVLESIERKHFRIIDGQQRLATLSVLILACVDYLISLANEGVDADENRERANLLESSYIGSKDPSSLRTIPKLRLNANDDDFFQLNIVQRKPPHGGARHLRDSERLLWECFSFFKSKIQEAFGTIREGQEVAEFVGRIVTERLLFISVRVQDQLSAYTVFETLNARGLELTETDLLKNYLLSLVDRSSSQMEPVLRQWVRITERVGIARFPEFLRHHLNSQRPFVRQRHLFRTIKREVTSVQHVFDLLDRMEADAVWYEALNDSHSEHWLDYQGGREHVRVLNLFGVSQYTPLVLSAKDAFKNPQDIVQVLRICAVLSVRFNGVSRRSTHELEAVYNRAALALRGTDHSGLKAVREAVLPIYVPDDEFESAFESLRLKNSGTSSKRLRYFLAQLERQSSGADLSDEAMTATVEHILPENPSEEWNSSFTLEAYDRCVDRLGNYCLLERGPNTQAASNAGFASKREVYARSQYKMARETAEFEEWTEATIARRQQQMARLAKSVWTLSL